MIECTLKKMLLEMGNKIRQEKAKYFPEDRPFGERREHSSTSCKGHHEQLTNQKLWLNKKAGIKLTSCEKERSRAASGTSL